MVAAAASNFTIGFALLLMVLYRAGDIQAAIDSPTGQPYIEILLNATQSVPGTAVLVVYIVLALVFCATNIVTTSSRQLFSFARDRGVPLSSSLSQVSGRSHVPVRAIVCTIMFTVVLSLVLIGSSLAFNIVNSLFGVALLGSYLISVSTLAYQRLYGFKLPLTRFSLGRFGLLINLATIAFDLFAFIIVRAAFFILCTAIANRMIDTFPTRPKLVRRDHELGLSHILRCSSICTGVLLHGNEGHLQISCRDHALRRRH